MASWITHLRIADQIWKDNSDLHNNEYIVGNLAPDFGEPNNDWTVFTPPRTVTHWWNETTKKIEYDRYFVEYMNSENRKEAFFIGYYCHLLVDYYWVMQIRTFFEKELQKSEGKYNPEQIKQYRKENMYFEKKYFSENRDKLIFKLFLSIERFPNIYLPFFSSTAFMNRIDAMRKIITRIDEAEDCQYLTEQIMNSWVDTVVACVKKQFEETKILGKS